MEQNKSCKDTDRISEKNTGNIVGSIKINKYG